MRYFFISTAIAVIAILAWRLGVPVKPESGPTDKNAKSQIDAQEAVEEKSIPANTLMWDSEAKEVSTKPGNVVVGYVFHATNVSTDPLVITGLHSPDKAATPNSATLPIKLQPGARTDIGVSLNLSGLQGAVTRKVTVITDKGNKVLEVRANLLGQSVADSPATPATPPPIAPTAGSPAVSYVPEGPPAIVPEGPPIEEGMLAWDSIAKKQTAVLGTANTSFAFNVTNVSKETITVTSFRTSCGCTSVKVPSMPWVLSPGAKGTIDVVMDLAGKRGVLEKNAVVITDRGYKSLTVRTDIQEPDASKMNESDRARNLQLATANRQTILKGECASCHTTPAKNKLGEELYHAACGICHDSSHRAASVPNLKQLNKPTNADYWRTWITSSADGKLMPAFGLEHDGILDKAQIESLVKYLTETVPSN
jgi:cytochrome c5